MSSENKGLSIKGSKQNVKISTCFICCVILPYHYNHHYLYLYSLPDREVFCCGDYGFGDAGIDFYRDSGFQ